MTEQEKARPPKMYPHALELFEVRTEDEVEELRQMVVYEDVWTAFHYPEPPTKGKFFLRFHNKQWVGYVIRERKSKKGVGLIIVMTRHSRTTNAVEVDMAVPNPEHRGMGITQTAGALLLDLWLMSDRIGQIFSRTAKSNALAMNAGKGFGHTFVPVSGELKSEFSNPDDAIAMYINKEMWSQLRQLHGAPPFVPPDGGQVYPPSSSRAS